MSDLPEPGTKVDDPVPSFACACLNDNKTHVMIPEGTVDLIKRASGIVEPLWPLGIYVGFTEEGISIGIFGRKENGEVTHGISQQAITEDACPPMGEVIWDLWKKLRRVPYSANFNMMGNYHTLKTATLQRHGLS